MAFLNNFRDKTITQIRCWAWAAAVLPISALAGIFFVWAFYDKTIFGYAMIIGETIMFMVAVLWWWWVMFVLKNLVNQWDKTKDGVDDVLKDIKGIRSIVQDLLSKDK